MSSLEIYEIVLYVLHLFNVQNVHLLANTGGCFWGVGGGGVLLPYDIGKYETNHICNVDKEKINKLYSG